MSNGIDRRTFIKGTGIVGIAGLAGCTGGPKSSGNGGSGNGSSSSATSSTSSSAGNSSSSTSGEGSTTTTGDNGSNGGSSGADVNVGMVYATGGLGDGSFNDAAQQGIKKAAKQFGVKYDESQPSQVSQFKNFQQQFAQSTSPNYDLVTCIGYLQHDSLVKSAKQYPKQDFMIVDSVVDADNVASYTFKEEEGSYLAGQLAGMLTTKSFSAGKGETNSDKKKVGFVGGVQGDLIGKFEAGYKAGVKAANSDVKVLSNYVGSFTDPTGGREAANSMYNSGADIVYHAAGNTGTGVFQAAQQKGKFAIGVDRDQSVTESNYKDVILASMAKRVDTAVFNAVKSVVNDDFQGGSSVTLGLKKNGVKLVYGQQLGAKIPSDVKSQIKASRQKIIDGKITVPTDPSKV